MRRGALLVGVACGIVCVLCVLMYASTLQQEADSARAEAMERYGGEQVDVLVATNDIYPGESLNSSNTTVRTWLSDLLPEDCITSLEDVQDKQTTSLILAGEAVSARRFDEGSTQLDIPAGCVAISVPAEEVQAVGGTLSAGSRVDVYATGTTTARLGSNMLVLATNADTEESSKTKVSWVTLAVPIEQSQEFVTASQSMDIYFTLPAQKDTDEESSSDAADGKSEDEGAEAQNESGAQSGATANGGAAATQHNSSKQSNQASLAAAKEQAFTSCIMNMSALMSKQLQREEADHE